MVVTIEEYRKILGDHKSTDEQIKTRLAYLEAFCRNVCKIELQNYVSTISKPKGELKQLKPHEQGQAP